MSRRALGRGIDALLSLEGEVVDKSATSSVPTTSLKISGDQPRKSFSQEGIEELARSIQSKGVLQPILVEPSSEGGPSGEGKFVIVAGERRFRAAKMAGLKEIPVLIRKFSELEKTEIALIENLQREDLTPVEEALGYKTLVERGGLTQEEVARRVGKNRSTVANSLRLLKLPEAMLEALDRGRISSGHARALLSLDSVSDQEVLFRRLIERQLSVRETESLASRLNSSRQEAARDQGNRQDRQEQQKSPQLRSLEQLLIERLGTKVSIKGSESRGKVEISYYSTDDLDRLCSLIAATE